MAKAAKKKDTSSLSAGDIFQSAVAVGSRAHASVNIRDAQLREADASLAKLIELLEMQDWQLEDGDEVQSDVRAVQGELDRKKPNLLLMRAAMKGIVASLGPAQALTGIAVQVLELIRRIG